MMSLLAAASALDARMLGADVRFSSVSTDSRSIPPGALFVALRGERFDGHEFLKAAKEQGAAAAMVDEAYMATNPASDLPVLIVRDTRAALGQLAAHWRARFRIPVIAVTGSNGKTTVKEMIAAVLRAHYGEARTLATEGNLNNDIGLPLTLLRLRPEHAAAVIELGMNHPGETAYLATLAAPTVAVVNNAQREHQEFMKSVADVAQEHGAVFSALSPGGVAVINADDDYADYWRGLVAAKPGVARLDFGIDNPAQVSATSQAVAFGNEMTLRTPAGGASVKLQAAGRHNVLNALAATASTIAAGATLDAVVQGLERLGAVKGRLQRKTATTGANLIDDTYNANPDSVRAAIAVLAAFPAPTVLVLGDMGEVGDQGPAFHREIGEYARNAGVSRLLCLGELARHACEAFGGGATHARSMEQLVPLAREGASQAATVLVKGSRFMRMERVVDALTGKEGV
jgi:UDP-N-acetylmuramoyl-tripeptide--D-alanyl-D-alanine ligase